MKVLFNSNNLKSVVSKIKRSSFESKMAVASVVFLGAVWGISNNYHKRQKIEITREYLETPKIQYNYRDDYNDFLDPDPDYNIAKKLVNDMNVSYAKAKIEFDKKSNKTKTDTINYNNIKDLKDLYNSRILDLEKEHF